VPLVCQSWYWQVGVESRTQMFCICIVGAPLVSDRETDRSIMLRVIHCATW